MSVLFPNARDLHHGGPVRSFRVLRFHGRTGNLATSTWVRDTESLGASGSLRVVSRGMHRQGQRDPEDGEGNTINNEDVDKQYIEVGAFAKLIGPTDGLGFRPSGLRHPPSGG